MKHNMITPYHSHDNGYVSLIVNDITGLPSTVIVDGKTLLLKSEFHVSLMALKNLVPILNRVNPGVTEADLVQDFLDYQAVASMSEYSPSKAFRYVTRDERETIVGMVTVSRLEGLFDQLRAKYEVDLPTQPTHITLYTLQPETGIGILSQDELNRDSWPIEVPTIRLN